MALAGGAGDARDRDASSSHPAKVVSVRFWSFDDLTRISIETSGDFELKYDRLDHPDRLFFDLVGTVSEVGPKGFRTIPVGDRIVRQIRVAETQHGVTRVVLDLNRFARFSTSRLENPVRLMIDVRDSDAAPVFGGPEPSIAANSPRRFIPPASPGRGFHARPVVDDPPDMDPPPLFSSLPSQSSNRLLAKLIPAPRPYGRLGKTSTTPRLAYSAPDAAPVDRRPLEPEGTPEPARRTA
ncbi:MAG: AMIN domain-containing protein, partial [Bryobacteraceae bacterium]